MSQNSSISYISFADSSYSVAEEKGRIELELIRSGSLTEGVSVHFETRDLTATAGEDFVALSDRTRWSPMDGTPKKIEVAIIPNEWPEGQESFELVLSDPVPANKCVVSGTGLTVIRITAKAETSSMHQAQTSKASLIAARLTIRISRPWDVVKPGELAGEEMRTALRDAIATSLFIDSNRIYLKGNNDIRPTEFGRVLFTFDILPPLSSDHSAPGKKGAKEIADEFVNSVADQSSALYGHGMDRLCPIDTTFMPEVRIFALDDSDVDSRQSHVPVYGIVIVMLALAVLVVVIHKKREQLMEVLLRWLSLRKFQSIRGTFDHDLHFDEGDYSEPGASGFSEFAVARIESGGLQEGLKRKVLHIELT